MSTELYGVAIHVFVEGDEMRAEIHHGVYDHEINSYPVFDTKVERRLDNEHRECIKIDLRDFLVRILSVSLHEGDESTVLWVDSPKAGALSVFDGTFELVLP